MEEHWRAGYDDAVRTLRHPEVLRAARHGRRAFAPSTSSNHEQRVDRNWSPHQREIAR